MKWISFIIEIAACIISFGICTAVIRAQFRPRDELAWWKYLVFGITFTAVTYFEVGSNLIASFIGMGICIFFAQRYFEGRFASKVISVIMINVLTILISIICLYVISAFSGVTMEKLTMYGNSMRLIEVCVMKSLCIFIAYAYIRTIKRQREFVQQELLISGIFFACFFVVVASNVYIHFISHTPYITFLCMSHLISLFSIPPSVRYSSIFHINCSLVFPHVFLLLLLHS